jgi:hypothetical protein
LFGKKGEGEAEEGGLKIKFSPGKRVMKLQFHPFKNN